MVFDHFLTGWLALKLTSNGWVTSDGRKPRIETIPWARDFPHTEIEKCTQINNLPQYSIDDRANVITIVCEYHRRGICEKPSCV